MTTKRSVLSLLLLGLAVYFGTRKETKEKVLGKIVQIKSGKIQGIVSKSRDDADFYEWLNIPYGKVAQRFDISRPVDPWDGVRDGSEYGPVCIQTEWISTVKVIGAEDCLSLNVHVPKAVFESGKLVPTMVWIHGGSFAKGSGSHYRPEYWMDEKIVIVTINYRLGPFGFLSTGDEHSRGNMGLKDQSLAIKWVKDNIAHFGGDGERITIFGESAGGAGTHFHLFSPMSRGLMTKMIPQSSVALIPYVTTTNPLGQAQMLARKVNCPVEGSKQMVECLRKIPADTLIKSLGQFLNAWTEANELFVPSIEKIVDEDTFLTEHPRDLLKSGNFTKIPTLVGTTTEEGLFFAFYYRNDQAFRDYLHNNFEKYLERAMFARPEDYKHSEKIREFYFGKNARLDIFSEGHFTNLSNLITDYFWFVDTMDVVEKQSKHAPVYLYEYKKGGNIPSFFDLFMGLPLPVLECLEEVAWKIAFYLQRFGLVLNNFGAAHGDDLLTQWIYAPVSSVDQNHPVYKFSKDFVKLWVDFAYDHTSLKFRGVALPPVPKTASEGTSPIERLEIDEEPHFRAAPEDVQRRIKFWKTLRNL